jgi:uncharacterized protein
MRCGVLHGWSLMFWLTALLYGGVPAFATDVPGTPAAQARPPDATEKAPHIAILLPLRSPAFARPAEAVRNGFVAASKQQGRNPLPLRVYSVSEEPQHVLAGYRDAVAAGARVIVGPITRDGVSALAASELVTVPTLALNAPDAGAASPPLLYTLSLQVEAEARQVAELAWLDGRRSAFTIVADTPLARRMQQAFAEAFTRLGGKQVADYTFSSQGSELRRLRDAVGLNVSDMAFLAVDTRQARIVRPYLGTLPLYATSHINPGAGTPSSTLDLDGIRFVDMPWLLQPDHTAVMVYPRGDYPDSPDLDRLYALGIDAFRVALELLEGKPTIMLDGVVGRLVLTPDRSFARGLPSGQITAGKVQVFGDARP